MSQGQTSFAPIIKYDMQQNTQPLETCTYGINGSIRKRVDHLTQNTDYYYFNVSGNLKACGTDMQISVYGYNSANTRTYKVNMFNANQWVNGQPQPIQPMVQSAMFYPNTYINFTQAGEYTKHYYNGTERIASRLGEQQIPISVENNQELEAYQHDVKQILYNAIGQHLYDNPVDFNYEGEHTLEFLQVTGDNNAIFYYHPNHLSSTMYVTDAQQSVVQSFLYAPYGDIISEYNTHVMGEAFPKYSFNAKELDEETGMYYYEARYYAPPVFSSRDPMFEKYSWMSPYAYCANNPVKYVDPSGNDIEAADDIVITGKNNSSVTVKTDLVDIEVNTNIDFGGNHEVDASRVAVGYERGVGATAEAGTGFGGSASVTSMMFLGGDFAGYWYDYAGGEAQAGMTLGLDVSAGIQANLVLGIYMGKDMVTPESFEGNYIGMSFSGGAKAFGGIEGNISVSRSEKWKTFSIGGKVTVGASAGIKASTSVNVGGLKLLTPGVPTKNRSMFDKAFNWISHLLLPF